MSTHRSRRIDHATAEQLLAGARSQASGTPGASQTSELTGSRGATDRSDRADHHESLAELLAAAAAPAGKSELSGEPEALAMFRAARLDAAAAHAPVPVRAPVPASPRRSPLTPAALLASKAAAAVLAVALGGVAVAAGTGNLPTVLGGAPEHDLPGASPAPGILAAEAPSPEASGRPSAAVPSDLAELCRAFTRATGARPDEVLAEQRFAVLVAAAGSRPAVPGYCARVQDGGPEPSASAATTAPAAAPTRNPRAATPAHPGKPDPSRRPVTPGPGTGGHGPGTRPPGPPSTVPSPPPPRGDVPTGRPPGAHP
ncbi:hypothetical protein OG730_09090 [Streptomyces sp. NBC_01298]|uniref:hypothetical protein n=1 Tax=Streptomyces sp. NBC_01298 TaxID=2903817 RepID=UPI002E12CBE9|nr:hypothetical protein OG730_09090 [Streptomyces sp. NBC_01298]